MNRTEQHPTTATTEHSPAKIAPTPHAYDPWIKTVCPSSNVIDNNSEAFIRAAAIKQSRVLSWKQGEYVTWSHSNGTTDVWPSPYAIEKAKTAGEQAVAAWRLQQQAVATLNLFRNL